MNQIPGDNDAYRFPVSIKGIVIRSGSVVLLKNRRDEWELPGGKLELGEAPELCVTREIEEELGLAVEATAAIDTWVYTIAEGTHVLIVTYGCTERVQHSTVLSDEHTEVAWIPLAEVERLHMPGGYKRSIARWSAMANSVRGGGATRESR